MILDDGKRNKYTDAIEAVESLVENALYTDGAHHKQWYLEQILHTLIKFDVATGDDIKYYTITEYDEHEVVSNEWEPGIAP